MKNLFDYICFERAIQKRLVGFLCFLFLQSSAITVAHPRDFLEIIPESHTQEIEHLINVLKNIHQQVQREVYEGQKNFRWSEASFEERNAFLDLFENAMNHKLAEALQVSYPQPGIEYDKRKTTEYLYFTKNSLSGYALEYTQKSLSQFEKERREFGQNVCFYNKMRFIPLYDAPSYRPDVVQHIDVSIVQAHTIEDAALRVIARNYSALGPEQTHRCFRYKNGPGDICLLDFAELKSENNSKQTLQYYYKNNAIRFTRGNVSVSVLGENIEVLEFARRLDKHIIKSLGTTSCQGSK